MNDPGAYVVREARRIGTGPTVVTVVDLAGVVRHVTVPYALTNSEHLDPVLRHAVAHARRPPRLP